MLRSHIKCVTQKLTQNSAELYWLQCRSEVLVSSQELLSISLKTLLLQAPKNAILPRANALQVRRKVREIQYQAQAIQPQQLLSLWRLQPPAANITL